MRVAVFVDAGYLSAGGSAAIAGSSLPRSRVDSDQGKIIAKLRKAAESQVGNGVSLLRIYWYDGVLPQGPSLEQQRLADADDVKLRLGIISPSGQQKGVDSLIVTDLVELARNQAVSDAVLLSGDEDVRIGVQIAQSFGVRVHLIGIEPSRGNQSRALMQEADTTTEWSKAEIGEFLTLKPGLDPTATSTGSGDTSEIGSDTKSALDEIVSEFVKSLESDQLRLIATLNEQDLIPEEHDRLLLGMSGRAIGRILDFAERRYLRDRFKQVARSSVAPES